MLVAGSEAVVNRPAIRKSIRKNIKPDEAGRALDRFYENERREQRIRQRIAVRPKHAIDQGGRVNWPVRVTWKCINCNQTNHGHRNKTGSPAQLFALDEEQQHLEAEE